MAAFVSLKQFNGLVLDPVYNNVMSCLENQDEAKHVQICEHIPDAFKTDTYLIAQTTSCYSM